MALSKEHREYFFKKEKAAKLFISKLDKGQQCTLEAINCFKKAIELNPKNKDAIKNLANAESKLAEANSLRVTGERDIKRAEQIRTLNL